MAGKWIHKLGIGMSVLMTVSQITGMAAFAAPDSLYDDEPEFEDLLEEKYEDVTDQEYIADEGDTEFEEFYTDANATWLSGDNDAFGTDGEDSISFSVEEWLNDYNYDISDYFKRVSIYSSKGTIDNEKVVIPAYTEIKGEQYRVVLDTSQLHKNGIEDSIWNADRDIEEIVIEKGVILVYGCNLFRNMNHLKKLNISGLDTSYTVTMADMFYGCSELKTLDVSGFDTSHVKSMSGMFNGCSKLKTLDLTGFDTSNVSSMDKMFYGCRKIEEVNLSSFDISNVTDIHSMFEGCERLTELDISGFDAQKATDCSSFFKGCTSLKKADLSSFKMYNSPKLKDMFKNCSSLEMIKVPLYISKNSEIVLPETFYDSTGKSYTKLESSDIEESYWIGKVGVDIPVQVYGEEFRQDKQGALCYYKNGIFQKDTFGFVDWYGSKFFLINGRIDSYANGLVNDIDHPEDWYYCSVGQVQIQYTGLAQYDGEWFYIKQGKLDTKLAAYVEYDDGLFYVAAGRLLSEVNGLAQDPNNSSDWYYLASGQAQLQYTGLALYDGEWFYIQSGKLVPDYTGKVTYDDVVFYMRNGKLINSEETIFQNTSTELSDVYVIDKATRTFHLPSCSVVDDMDPYNRLYVSNTSAQELKDAGCTPCEYCNPR